MYYFILKNEVGIMKCDFLSVIFFIVRWLFRKDEKGEFVRKCGGNCWFEKYVYLFDFYCEKFLC